MSQTAYTVELQLEMPVFAQTSADVRSPATRPTGNDVRESRNVEAVVLENDFIAATFVPGLGGRLLNLVDKTNSVDCFTGSLKSPDLGADFGHGGLEVTLDGTPRSNSLKPVRAALTEEGLRLSEVGAPGGIGFELLATLGQGAELKMELRFRSRRLSGALWNPGLLWSNEGWTVDRSSDGVILYSASRDSGFAILTNVSLQGITSSAAVCFAQSRVLPPRWGETVSFSIVPIGGIGRGTHANSVAALGMGDLEFVVQPRLNVSEAKLLLKTSNGQTLEAPANLEVDKPLRYTYAEIGGRPEAFAILDSSRAELFRFPPKILEGASAPAALEYPDPPPSDLSGWEREPAYRYWVANLRTRAAFEAGDFAAALSEAETALLYNGDDPLAWIEKAIAARHLGEENPEAPELPNAHYLAPLEPLLRAEGFLAQSGLDARTFLAPLAEHPNELVEASCFFIERGLYEDAARFIDAALAVREAPMLRFLYAYVCLATGKMKADAASAVASVKELEPPLPWREVERVALAKLKSTFPGNPILDQFCALVGE